jgi:hypothetical protein
MDAFGLSFCNGQQTFSKKVIIGRGEVFNIGQIWVQAYPFDLNFQMTYYSGGGENTAQSDLMKSDCSFSSPLRVAFPIRSLARCWCPPR